MRNTWTYLLNLVFIYFVISPLMIWSLDIFLGKNFDAYLTACTKGMGLIVLLAFTKLIFISKNMWMGEW